jgi:hypothetical protein
VRTDDKVKLRYVPCLAHLTWSSGHIRPARIGTGIIYTCSGRLSPSVFTFLPKQPGLRINPRANSEVSKNIVGIRCQCRVGI